MTVDVALVEAATHDLLVALGEDPTRPGLLDTPRRVARYWAELMDADHGAVDRIFEMEGKSHYDEMISLSGIRFYSLCEHHLLPFFGTVSVAYIPNGQGVIGMSKLVRIVRRHAGRLQVQERLTSDVADQVLAITNGIGVGVRVQATHLCAAMRGVRSEESIFTTTAVRGVMLTKPEARHEFLASVGAS